MSMKEELYVKGMTCNACVEKVKSTLELQENIDKVELDLQSGKLNVHNSSDFDIEQLNSELAKKGNYSISNKKPVLSDLPEIKTTEDLPEKSINTYFPLILIVTFIAGCSLLAQYPFESFDWRLSMRYFMAGFFLVFSFFKLLNIEGFANSYRMYDIIAAKWPFWGKIYPFLELGLGIAYFINFEPFITNLSTVILLGVSSIGVIESNLNKRKIKCACLGDVFNLPMSTVTIIEDLSMVGMAAIMLFF